MRVSRLASAAGSSRTAKSWFSSPIFISASLRNAPGAAGVWASIRSAASERPSAALAAVPWQIRAPSRLNIRKANLREWRRGFAKHLNDLGVAANATERSVRGVTGLRKLDAIYRPMRDSKRHSTHLERRVRAVGVELQSGRLSVEPGKAKLLETRRAVERGWSAIQDALIREGHSALAGQVKSFVSRMPAPRTDKEWIAAKLLEVARKPKVVEQDLAR